LKEIVACLHAIQLIYPVSALSTSFSQGLVLLTDIRRCAKYIKQQNMQYIKVNMHTTKYLVSLKFLFSHSLILSCFIGSFKFWL